MLDSSLGLRLKGIVMVYTISYDLKAPGRNYDALHGAIKRTGHAWWHYLESTWLIATNLDSEQISEVLRSHIDANDHLLVIDVGSDFSGWLPAEAWQWIRTHRRAA